MIDVIQIATNYDQAEAALSELIQRAGEAAEALTNSHETITENLQEELSSVTDSIDTINSGIRQSETEIENHSASIQQSIADFTTASDEIELSVVNFQTATQESRTDFDSGIQSVLDLNIASNSRAESSVETAYQSIVTLSASMQEAESKTTESVSQFAESVTGYEGVINDQSQKVNDGFSQLIGSLSGEFNQNSEAVMTQLSEMMSQSTDLAGTSMEQLQGIGEDTLNQFQTDFSGFGEDLEQRAADILSELSNHVSVTASSKVNDVVQGIIGDAVTRLSSEIAQSIAVTQIGASTTATLSPILPQLAAAKAIVGAVESALSLLDSIF
ncbi:MAG: hypothetical protein P1U89_21190 [Verrucomicrobiales bacterium]|nr:hypothetical protein [Verrucomicrobiales bacterium]